ncbi:nuclear transport factor 2 family protein [Spirosoma sp.]|uniref:nuclear transport factor 2 family protein n=1 Tax=Spirosoma sp. TaxID=1899569 RepID=UPI00263568DA|nr:nuclear transport factor 2 family protein [Spirosoma sp.]MCX6214428.1 nuclear transport factor 2 family protein [Spirosoma sp.]
MKHLIQAYIEAYNAKDIPAMLALLDDHIVFENVSNTLGITKTTSKSEFEQIAIQSVTYFSERKQTIRFLLVGTNAAAVEIDYQATLAQDLPNGLKAADQLSLRGVSLFEIQNGKITRISDYS